MSLVGNLEDLSLGDILQIISLSQKSGVLAHTEPSARPSMAAWWMAPLATSCVSMYACQLMIKRMNTTASWKFYTAPFSRAL